LEIGRRKFVIAMSATLICGLLPMHAVGETLSLSGKVSDTTAHAVPSATIWAKRLRDGKVYTAKSSGDGDYLIPDLEPGDYKVWAKAGKLSVQPVKVTLAAGQTTDLVLSPTPNRVK